MPVDYIQILYNKSDILHWIFVIIKLMEFLIDVKPILDMVNRNTSNVFMPCIKVVCQPTLINMLQLNLTHVYSCF